MSDYDCDILELEISDDDTTFREVVSAVQSPEKRRRIVEESVQESYSDDRTVTILPSSIVWPVSTPASSTASSTLNSAIPEFQYIDSSHKATARLAIYRSRIPLVYPKAPVQETRHISFVPGNSDSENDDEDLDFVDSGVHSLVEDYTRRSTDHVWPKYKFGPTPVASFVPIAWNDLLGREFAENDLPNQDPTVMVEILKPEALRLISRTGPFFVTRTGKHRVCQIRSGERIAASDLKEFLLTVHAWRVLCFDTEGDQKLLRYNVEPNKGQLGRTPVIFGNPAGQVIIYHDARDTAPELVQICANFRYVKFQSGVENDLKMLLNNGFAVFRGIVDVQTLITLVRPAVDQCGIEFCTQYVWGNSSEFNADHVKKPTASSTLRTKWTQFFNQSYQQEKMTGLCLDHSLQDVLVPFAILVKIGLEIADLRGATVDPSENIFLTMNEALELCLSKAPADIRNKSHDHLARVSGADKLFNWTNDGAIEECSPFQFNSHYLVHRIRRARADLIELHYTGLSWDEIQNLALLHIDLLQGRMPFSNELSFLDLRFHIMDHCMHCGSLDHRSAACFELTSPCEYEHGPDVDLPTHSIVCCPALHAFCNRCSIRGHLAETHGKGWKSAAQLRRLFLENAPRGLFTSLLYLIRTDLTSANVRPHHFRLGISGRRLVQAFGDYWIYGGLGRISEAEKQNGARYREVAERNLSSTPETYETLWVVNKVKTVDQRAKAILVEQGVISDPSKRLSGAQRRKRRLLAAELEAKDREDEIALK